VNRLRLDIQNANYMQPTKNHQHHINIIKKNQNIQKTSSNQNPILNPVSLLSPYTKEGIQNTRERRNLTIALQYGAGLSDVGADTTLRTSPIKPNALKPKSTRRPQRNKTIKRDEEQSNVKDSPTSQLSTMVCLTQTEEGDDVKETRQHLEVDLTENEKQQTIKQQTKPRPQSAPQSASFLRFELRGLSMWGRPSTPSLLRKELKNQQLMKTGCVKPVPPTTTVLHRKNCRLYTLRPEAAHTRSPKITHPLDGFGDTPAFTPSLTQSTTHQNSNQLLMESEVSSRLSLGSVNHHHNSAFQDFEANCGNDNHNAHIHTSEQETGVGEEEGEVKGHFTKLREHSDDFIDEDEHDHGAHIDTPEQEAGVGEEEGEVKGHFTKLREHSDDFIDEDEHDEHRELLGCGHSVSSHNHQSSHRERDDHDSLGHSDKFFDEDDEDDKPRTHQGSGGCEQRHSQNSHATEHSTSGEGSNYDGDTSSASAITNNDGLFLNTYTSPPTKILPFAMRSPPDHHLCGNLVQPVFDVTVHHDDNVVIDTKEERKLKKTLSLGW